MFMFKTSMCKCPQDEEWAIGEKVSEGSSLVIRTSESRGVGGSLGVGLRVEPLPGMLRL